VILMQRHGGYVLPGELNARRKSIRFILLACGYIAAWIFAASVPAMILWATLNPEVLK